MAALLLYIYLFIILKETKIDTLTGLDNRHSFFEYINRLSRNKTGDAWNIVILDIKNFKSINEIYGHLEGDNALRSLAEIIKTFVKKTDFAARYGGDEFAIVTKAEAGIEEMMNGINEELGRLNEKSKKLYNIEVSYESGVFTADGNMSIEKILNNIDKLMRKRHEESRRAGDLKAGANA
jgi:diguanylate cyclase (GGDEF)-like protein